MCRRLSGHAILCSQGKWGRGGVPRSVLLGFLFPVRGCVEPSITLSEAACRWRHVRVLEVKIYYFLFTRARQRAKRNSSGEQFGVASLASRAITPWIRDGSLIAAHNMLWVLWVLWGRPHNTHNNP